MQIHYATDYGRGLYIVCCCRGYRPCCYLLYWLFVITGHVCIMSAVLILSLSSKFIYILILFIPLQHNYDHLSLSSFTFSLSSRGMLMPSSLLTSTSLGRRRHLSLKYRRIHSSRLCYFIIQLSNNHHH